MNEDGLIDYQEFGQINDRYPLVLFPAFRLQDVMQRNSLGKFSERPCTIKLLFTFPILTLHVYPLSQ